MSESAMAYFTKELRTSEEPNGGVVTRSPSWDNVTTNRVDIVVGRITGTSNDGECVLRAIDQTNCK